MGASGKWVKSLIGLKKPEKDDHVSSKSRFFFLPSCIDYILCNVTFRLTLRVSLCVGQGEWKK